MRRESDPVIDSLIELHKPTPQADFQLEDSIGGPTNVAIAGVLSLYGSLNLFSTNCEPRELSACLVSDANQTPLVAGIVLTGVDAYNGFSFVCKTVQMHRNNNDLARVNDDPLR
jgi:hypothetical protein